VVKTVKLSCPIALLKVVSFQQRNFKAKSSKEEAYFSYFEPLFL
jgi:hypothetical protein